MTVPPPATRHRLRLSSGPELSYVTAGDPGRPVLLLLHGFPSSLHSFRDIIPPLAATAYVIAPDLPGFGESDVLPSPSFAGFAAAIGELLENLAIGPRYIYLHDFGAPVGMRIAMAAPDLVLGLIIQNANVHHSGLGPAWADTFAYWSDPSDENEAAATAHLTAEGIRDQYVVGVPADVAARIAPAVWDEDWRIMSQPGRLQTQRALIADYASHVADFAAIAAYLAEARPPALMVWGRHDAFFDIAETLSLMQALPRMEAHVLDGGHFLLETHATPAAALIGAFIERTAPAGRSQ